MALAGTGPPAPDGASSRSCPRNCKQVAHRFTAASIRRGIAEGSRAGRAGVLGPLGRLVFIRRGLGRLERCATTREPGDLPSDICFNHAGRGAPAKESDDQLSKSCLHGFPPIRFSPIRGGAAMTALAGAGPHVAGDPLAAADPQGALRAALLGQVDPALRAEEILLGWLLRLADGVDPAVAAGHVMEAVDRGALRNGRLLDLLAEVASWPASRLARLEPGGKRH
jgi:hypothetical protein